MTASRPPAKPRARKPGTLRRLLLKGAVLTAIWGTVAGLLLLAWFAHDLPDAGRAVQLDRRPTLTVVAADGTTLARFGDLRGDTVTLEQLPPHLVTALIATEDRRYWWHPGIDPIGIVRAAWVNWQAGRVRQGGSTITQQLVKNLFLSPEQTMRRKIQEALLALRLESLYSKTEILEAYLNSAYFGAGTYGIAAAAQTHFNKAAGDLSLRESAILVGLLKAPSRYTPSAAPDRAIERMRVVLGIMLEQGVIGEAEYVTALEAPSVPRRKPGSEGDARYAAAWVADQVAGFVGSDVGDLTVYTTIDPTLQRAAQARVVGLLRGAGAEAGAGQAALVAMSPDGAVKALVGGRDFDDSQFNRATQALRQPGSAFKPVVFLAALEAGLTPDATVLDAPYRKGTWTPANYDGRFRGDVTLRDALAHSLNTATVRLLEQVGVERAVAMARRLGLTTPMGRDLSLALGTSEVTLLELTGAYATVANLGRGVIPYAILEIRDGDGQVLYRRQGSGAGYALAGPDVQAMTRMLLGPITYGTGTVAQLDRMAVGKTGTTQDYKDAWFVGFTADLVMGVWLGNDDGTPMKRVTGGGLPARLWRDVMADAHAGQPPRDLPGLSDDPEGTIRPRLVPPGGDPLVAEAAAPTPEGVARPEPPPDGDAVTRLLRRFKGQ